MFRWLKKFANFDRLERKIEEDIEEKDFNIIEQVFQLERN